jgi:adenosylmethionine---8-amino-7-oxononanoate aminotransferase
LLACEQAGIVPDLLCLSKGLSGGSLPLAVSMATPAIFEAHLSTDRAKTFFHSSSYTANAIACAAANANLAIWREEPVRVRVADLTRRQSVKLTEIAALPGIANPRQIGTITAMEVADHSGNYLSNLGPALLAHFTANNLLLRPLGNTVYVMPPYCIDDSDLDAIYAGIAAAVSDLVS